MGSSSERNKGFIGTVSETVAKEIGKHIAGKIIDAFGGGRGVGAQPSRPRGMDWGDRMRQDRRDMKEIDRQTGRGSHTPGGRSYTRDPHTGRVNGRSGSFGEPAPIHKGGSPMKRVE